MAATGILAAERKRNRSGEGELVNLALSDVGIWVASALGHLAESALLDRSREADGNHIYGAFGHDFLTKDNRRIMLTALTKAQWRRLKKAMCIEDSIIELENKYNTNLDDEGCRYEFRDEIVRLIVPYVANNDYNKIKGILDDNGVLWGPYQTFDHLVKHDQRCSEGNPLIQIISQEGIGKYPAAGLPLRFQALEEQPVKPAPSLGEHTNEVISDMLGLPDHTIDDLHNRGIIGGES
jgi:2-methylfumaryl-CoA isomerase